MKSSKRDNYFFFLIQKEQLLDWLVLASGIALACLTVTWSYPYPGTISDSYTYLASAIGKNYLAYTFGVRNASSEANAQVSYRASLVLENEYKGADEAVRVMVFRNGKPTTYAKPRTDNGEVESFAADKNFLEPDVVFEDVRSDFEVGEVDRYTVIIWLEGEDPECVNAIMGGEAKFSMNFEVIGGSTAEVG